MIGATLDLYSVHPIAFDAYCLCYIASTTDRTEALSSEYIRLLTCFAGSDAAFRHYLSKSLILRSTISNSENSALSVVCATLSPTFGAFDSSDAIKTSALGLPRLWIRSQ